MCPLMNSVQLLRNQDPQIGVLRSWADAPHFSSPKPITDSFVVFVNHSRPDSFPEETQEGRELRSFDAAPQARHPVFHTSRASAPSPHHDQAVPLTIHKRLMCLKLSTESHRWRQGSESLQLACTSFCAFQIPSIPKLSDGFSSIDIHSEGTT